MRVLTSLRELELIHSGLYRLLLMPHNLTTLPYGQNAIPDMVKSGIHIGRFSLLLGPLHTHPHPRERELSHPEDKESATDPNRNVRQNLLPSEEIFPRDSTGFELGTREVLTIILLPLCQTGKTRYPIW